MKMRGKLADVSIDFKTGKQKISFILDTKIDNLDEIDNIEKLDIEAKKHREKRSLDANAYCWVLLGKLSEKMGISSKDIYIMEIRNIGVYEVLPIKEKAVDKFIDAWQNNGIGWPCEKLGKSKLEGYINIKAYYGSSTYDTKQMSSLIDSIVEDCKLQGIETATPEELERLKLEWK